MFSYSQLTTRYTHLQTIRVIALVGIIAGGFWFLLYPNGATHSVNPYLISGAPHVVPTMTHLEPPPYPLCFIGDSRTVGLENALFYTQENLDHHQFYAKVGGGYSWFSCLQEVKDLSPSLIIINLGVNDLGNISSYESLYKAYCLQEWRSCPVYFLSVNPCILPCTTVDNGSICQFNQRIKALAYDINNAPERAGAPKVHYIDSYTFLLQEGFESNDGLHYSASTYLKLYRFILQSLEEPVYPSCSDSVKAPTR